MPTAVASTRGATATRTGSAGAAESGSRCRPAPASRWARPATGTATGTRTPRSCSEAPLPEDAVERQEVGPGRHDVAAVGPLDPSVARRDCLLRFLELYVGVQLSGRSLRGLDPRVRALLLPERILEAPLRPL